MRRAALVCLCLSLLSGCDQKRYLPVTESIFDAGVISGKLDTKELKEASGLSASVNNPNLLWAHNDGGNEARIFLLDKQAHIKATIRFANINQRDWEDIAVGPGPEEGKNYIYVGDIGDNESKHNDKFIYRVEEPLVDWRTTVDTTLKKIDCIKFQLPDGSRDAEALLVDPLTRDIYVFSKREVKVNLYKLAYPQSTTEIIQAELVLPKLEFNQFEARSVSKMGEETLINGYHSTFYNQIVSCDISDDGLEILVKSYSSVYYWKRTKEESIIEVLQKTPILLPYFPEPQGEAIAFDVAGTGYYTVSEERGELPQRLFFYKRK
jgi:hypothetical protein